MGGRIDEGSDLVKLVERERKRICLAIKKREKIKKNGREKEETTKRDWSLINNLWFKLNILLWKKGAKIMSEYS